VKGMNEILQKIIEKLKEKEIEFNLIQLKDRAMIVEEVIKFSDGKVNPKEICKTLILKDQENNSYVVVALGNDRIDFEKVSKRFDCSRLRLATPEEVKQEIGLEIGAVCPLFLELPMLIDRRIFNREKINFGSGDHLFGIEINSKDILKCVEAKISDIVV
jgi:prolyl-tRNA editing enzyme YbaK/EbsC (Cys-tRNA(Pro) deacylase)